MLYVQVSLNKFCVQLPCTRPAQLLLAPPALTILKHTTVTRIFKKEKNTKNSLYKRRAQSSYVYSSSGPSLESLLSLFSSQAPCFSGTPLSVELLPFVSSLSGSVDTLLPLSPTRLGMQKQLHVHNIIFSYFKAVSEETRAVFNELGHVPHTV